MNGRLRTILKWGIGTPVSLAICAAVFYLLLRMGTTARLISMFGIFAIGFSVLLFNIIRSRKNEKLVTSLLDILYKKADPARFVSASKASIEKTKNKALLGTLYLNLAIGYEAMGDFGTAIAVMKENIHLFTDKLSKAIYFVNMASFYAQKGAVDEGLEMYQTGRSYVEKCKKQIPAAYMLFARGLLFYAEEQYTDALDSFRKVQAKDFEDRHALTKLQLYEARTLQKLGNSKEAKAIYGKICQKNTYPYLLQCAKEERSQLGENA